MAEIERYNVIGHDAEMEEAIDGDFILHEDHIKFAADFKLNR